MPEINLQPPTPAGESPFAWDTRPPTPLQDLREALERVEQLVGRPPVLILSPPDFETWQREHQADQ
jgi:hypothetical protein